MHSMRGFEHLDLVAKAVNALYQTLGSARMRSFPETFQLGSSAGEIARDPVIGTQRLARRIADHYDLRVATIVVTFCASLVPAGQVEISAANEIFVEIQARHRSDPKAIAAILAHEIAHIFLHRNGVGFPVVFENEVLTDTTAAYLGFGPTILNASTPTPMLDSAPSGVNFFGESVFPERIQGFGYLSLDEFAYILARRDALYGCDSSSLLDRGFVSSVFSSGRARYRRELGARPFVMRPWYERLARALSNDDQPTTPAADRITFQCPCCWQGLRVPETRKKLSVHCPKCDSRFPCYS